MEIGKKKKQRELRGLVSCLFCHGKRFVQPSSIVSSHDEVLLRSEGANQICTKASLRPLPVRLVQHILVLLRCRLLLKSTRKPAKRRRKY